jgi:hypothetical protein
MKQFQRNVIEVLCALSIRRALSWYGLTVEALVCYALHIKYFETFYVTDSPPLWKAQFEITNVAFVKEYPPMRFALYIMNFKLKPIIFR